MRGREANASFYPPNILWLYSIINYCIKNVTSICVINSPVSEVGIWASRNQVTLLIPHLGQFPGLARVIYMENGETKKKFPFPG